MKKLILLFLFPTFAYAEPGPVTQYLMNEPATLFDVAMLRLEHSIGYSEKQLIFNYKHKAQSESVGGNVNVYYRPEDDKIYVDLSTMDESATEEQMEAGCRYALQHMRIFMRKWLPTLFQHVGFLDSSEPSELMSAATEMFELRCHVMGHDPSMGRFWATQTLHADDMTIGKWSTFN